MYLLLLFTLGLILLLIGSKGVIANALKISGLFKIPPFVIGVSIVAIGTSLPEMVVSFFGGLNKSPGLALGNIIGSNIANIGFILGISLLLRPIYIGTKKTQKNMLVTLAVSVFLFFTLLLGGITLVHGLLFVILGIGVIWWQVVQGKKDGIIDEPSMERTKNPILTLSLFMASLVGLFIGGKLLVDSGVSIANLFKIKPVIIGATVVAIGTSIPELAVSITALTRKNVTRNEEKLVIGNILGSNIFNILFGVGTLGLFGVKNFNSQLSLYTFLGFTLVLCLLLFLFQGKKIPKYIGGILLISYIAYLVLLFGSA